MPIHLESEVLKSALTQNTLLVERCTIAVFIGLLVEYTILLWLKRKDFSRTEMALTVIAGIAIAGGVYGEYFFGSKASEAAMKLASISEQRVADSNREAGNARKEAGKAIERASKADDRASANEKEAARLTRDNLVLQAEVLKLRERMADRDLTHDQRSKMSRALSVYHPGDEDVLVESLVSEGREALRYANVIAALLRAKWSTIPQPSGNQLISSPLSGILVEPGSSPSAVAAARIITEAFWAAGIRVSSSSSDNFGNKRVLVLIGGK